MTDTRTEADHTLLTIDVTGNGYNGGGVFDITTSGDLIQTLVIRAS